jgi:hypothetical protein
LKIIPDAFDKRAVLKLMFGELIRAAERLKSTKAIEFERRQLSAVKKALDREYRLKQVPIGNRRGLHPAKCPAVLRLALSTSLRLS